MRPYFFKRAAPSVDKRAIAYQQQQRDKAWARGDGGTENMVRTVARIIKQIFAVRRSPAPWEQRTIDAAVSKRESRRARNVRWWGGDKNWRRT